MTVFSASLLAVLWLDISPDSNASKLVVTACWTDPPDAAAAVEYEYSYRLLGGETVKTGYTAYESAALDLSNGKSPGYFTVRARVTRGTRTTEYRSVNKIGLRDSLELSGGCGGVVPIVFEQPGPVSGTPISMETLFMCETVESDKIFGLSHSDGCDDAFWVSDIKGCFSLLPRYRIGNSGSGKSPYSEAERALCPGARLHDLEDAESHYWICGQVVDGTGSSAGIPDRKPCVQLILSTYYGDRYGDGKPVLEGGCYALVKVGSGDKKVVFTEDGRLANQNQKLIAFLPEAKNRILPYVLVEFDADLSVGEIAGDYVLCLLDTRLRSDVLAPMVEGVPLYVKSCGSLFYNFVSFTLSGSTGLQRCSLPYIYLDVKEWPSEMVVPRIESIRVSETNVILGVQGMVPVRDYFALAGTAIDSFETTSTNRPNGNVFTLAKDPTNCFFKIIGRPKEE